MDVAGGSPINLLSPLWTDFYQIEEANFTVSKIESLTYARERNPESAGSSFHDAANDGDVQSSIEKNPETAGSFFDDVEDMESEASVDRC